MWILPVTRRDLVDLISPRQKAVVPILEEHRPTLGAIRPDGIAAIWPAHPSEFGQLPTAIVVPEESCRDILAWLTTYVRELQPFTAFCRVVERPVADRFLEGPVVPHLHGVEGICSGLILGEALTHAHGRASILDLPVTAYSATLSHVISRTFALTGGLIPLESIGNLWYQAREITGQNGMRINPDLILSVWAIALETPPSFPLFGSSEILSVTWSELKATGGISESLWRELTDGFPNLDRMRTLIELPREQRIQMFDVALRVLANTGREGDERRSFLAGYFTNLLAPGSIDHADILAPFAKLFPTAYLWYGLCAGVNMRGESLPVGNPLARRIVHDLTIPDRLIDRPRCDVAIEELAMLGSMKNLLRLTAKAQRLDIDILPGVTVAFRWPSHEMANENEDDRQRDRQMEAEQLLSEMDEITMRCQHLSERLHATMNLNKGKPNSRRKRSKS